SFGQLRRQLARQLADDSLPLALCRFVLGHPEALGQHDFHLVFVGSSIGFLRRAAHEEFSGGTPAKLDATDRALLASPSASEARRSVPRTEFVHRCHRRGSLTAEKRTEQD